MSRKSIDEATINDSTINDLLNDCDGEPARKPIGMSKRQEIVFMLFSPLLAVIAVVDYALWCFLRKRNRD